MIANTITQLGGVANPFAPPQPTSAMVQVRGTQSFDEVLGAAMEMINTANTAQIEADAAQLDFITGQSDNMLAVFLAQERAFAAMNFTVNVVNRAVSAYQEIMRMQV